MNKEDILRKNRQHPPKDELDYIGSAVSYRIYNTFVLIFCIFFFIYGKTNNLKVGILPIVFTDNLTTQFFVRWKYYHKTIYLLGSIVFGTALVISAVVFYLLGGFLQ